MDERQPIIVGVGQATQRPGSDPPREPLVLMTEASNLAAQTAASRTCCATSTRCA